MGPSPEIECQLSTRDGLDMIYSSTLIIFTVSTRPEERGGGQGVRVLAIYSDDQSSKPLYTTIKFCVKIALKER